MDIIKESFPVDKTLSKSRSNYFHTHCFNLEKEVRELNEIAVPFHEVVYEALNYEEFISNNDGHFVTCFRCADTIRL